MRLVLCEAGADIHPKVSGRDVKIILTPPAPGRIPSTPGSTNRHTYSDFMPHLPQNQDVPSGHPPFLVSFLLSNPPPPPRAAGERPTADGCWPTVVG